MKIHFIMIRVGVCSCYIFNNIHCVLVEINVILFILIRADFARNNKLVMYIVRYTLISLNNQDNKVGPRIVHRHAPLALKIIRLLA